MTDTQNAETNAVPDEHHHKSDVRATSPSRRAAAIEAAYILEAVRK